MPTFYSDSECQTPYDKTTTVTSTTTIYALVNPTSEYKVQATDLTGTLNGQFKNGFKFVDTAASIAIDNGVFKMNADGSTTDKYIAITLLAGTYTVKVDAKSGSSSGNAKIKIDGIATPQELEFTTAQEEKTATITLTATTTIKLYRTGGKTAKVTSFTVTANE